MLKTKLIQLLLKILVQIIQKLMLLKVYNAQRSNNIFLFLKSQFPFIRAKQEFIQNIFEDGEENKLREVPKEYGKSDYHARKTCNYITVVLEVLVSVAALVLPVPHQQLAGLFLLPAQAEDCHTEGDPGQPTAGHDPHHS